MYEFDQDYLDALHQAAAELGVDPQELHEALAERDFDFDALMVDLYHEALPEMAAELGTTPELLHHFLEQSNGDLDTAVEALDRYNTGLHAMIEDESAAAMELEDAEAQALDAALVQPGIDPAEVRRRAEFFDGDIQKGLESYGLWNETKLDIAKNEKRVRHEPMEQAIRDFVAEQPVKPYIYKPSARATARGGDDLERAIGEYAQAKSLEHTHRELARREVEADRREAENS